jgi:HTH-type transcriptional regulator / antitoxin HipB
MAERRIAADSAIQMHDRSFLANLSRELRERRLALGLNQVDLAELAGCSTRFVHTIEAGKPTVRIDKLLDLLAVLGLRLRLEPAQGSSPLTPNPLPHDSQ